MATTAKAAKAAPEETAKSPLDGMSMEELGRELDRLDAAIYGLSGERIVVKNEMGRRLGVDPVVNGMHSNNGNGTTAAAKTSPAPPKKPAAQPQSADDKPAGGGKMRGQWKPAILVFLRDRENEGAKLNPITVHCIAKVKAGEITTKIEGKDSQVASNVSQALNAMKKDKSGPLVRQDESKTYFITQEGLNWLELQNL